MTSKSLKNHDLNSTTCSTFSCLGDADDTTERLKQLRARNKALKEERDQIGHEYDEIKLQLEKSEADRKQMAVERERYGWVSLGKLIYIQALILQTQGGDGVPETWARGERHSASQDQRHAEGECWIQGGGGSAQG